tara:strand:+ start:781 stop:1002 length:222 start_codon:yes stop_codon:yes gene_type:complete
MENNEMFYSAYYRTHVSAEQLEEAYDLYVNYCNENNLKDEAEEIIEFHGLSGLHEGMIDHILYHAEIAGFKVE